MNYLGTVSILDRGDAPAQAVIDRNSRSFAERVANETKEELEKVMHRVDNICQNFEMTNELYSDVGSNMEFVSDIAELTEILKDQVKKKKYQAQVTVFVVGFQDVSTQKLKLLQQVNEFFMDSIRAFDDDPPSTPDVDLDDVTHKIDESLDVARGLANRLGDINQDIIEFLLNYAENKAKNKGKKKLEKALQAAKDDLGSLSEKLMAVQSEIEDKEDKMQQLYKQLEIKTLENQKYRSAAEVAKKNLMDSQSLKDDITMREEKIKDMRQVISRLEIDLAQARHSHEQSQNRLENASLETQQKLKELQKGVDGSKMESNEAKREIEKVHESQIKKMLASHSQEIEDMKQQHTEEINNLTDEISTIIKYHESSPSTISNTTESRNQIVIPQMNQRPIPQINQTLIPQIKYHSSSSTKKRKKRSPILYQQEEEEDEEEEPTTSLENGGSAKKPSLDMEIVMDKIEKLQNTFEEGIATLQNQLRDERKFYMECEERRLKFFAELEEKRRRDEREHELKLFKLFTNVQTQNNSREQSSSGQISEPNLLVPNISQCRDTNL